MQRKKLFFADAFVKQIKQPTKQKKNNIREKGLNLKSLDFIQRINGTSIPFMFGYTFTSRNRFKIFTFFLLVTFSESIDSFEFFSFVSSIHP